jgi:hypothetical protein
VTSAVSGGPYPEGRPIQVQGVFASLFDFSFRLFITGRIIRVLYVLSTIIVAFWTLFFILVAFRSSERSPGKRFCTSCGKALA